MCGVALPGHLENPAASTEASRASGGAEATLCGHKMPRTCGRLVVRMTPPRETKQSKRSRDVASTHQGGRWRTGRECGREHPGTATGPELRAAPGTRLCRASAGHPDPACHTRDELGAGRSPSTPRVLRRTCRPPLPLPGPPACAFPTSRPGPLRPATRHDHATVLHASPHGHCLGPCEAASSEWARITHVGWASKGPEAGLATSGTVVPVWPLRQSYVLGAGLGPPRRHRQLRETSAILTTRWLAFSLR